MARPPSSQPAWWRGRCLLRDHEGHLVVAPHSTSTILTSLPHADILYGNRYRHQTLLTCNDNQRHRLRGFMPHPSGSRVRATALSVVACRVRLYLTERRSFFSFFRQHQQGQQRNSGSSEAARRYPKFLLYFSLLLSIVYTPPRARRPPWLGATVETGVFLFLSRFRGAVIHCKHDDSGVLTFRPQS